MPEPATPGYRQASGRASVAALRSRPRRWAGAAGARCRPLRSPDALVRARSVDVPAALRSVDVPAAVRRAAEHPAQGPASPSWQCAEMPGQWRDDRARAAKVAVACCADAQTHRRQRRCGDARARPRHAPPGCVGGAGRLAPWQPGRAATAPARIRRFRPGRPPGLQPRPEPRCPCADAGAEAAGAGHMYRSGWLYPRSRRCRMDRTASDYRSNTT